MVNVNELINLKKMSAKNSITYSIIILFSLFFFTACEDEKTDSTAPGMVSNVEIIPTYGGAKVSYTLPADEDVLFAKAYYTNTLGDKLFKVSSFYTDTIIIDGYNDTDEHSFTIVAVDRDKNESEPLKVNFTPLQSNIEIVKETSLISPEYGGIKMKWNNPTGGTVFNYLTYTNEDGSESFPQILSSESINEDMIIRGMDSTRKEFFVQVEDFYGNKTAKVSKGFYSPIFEEKIDKTKWTLVENLSVDGNAWEGKTTAIWDDILDTKESGGQGSYAVISRDNNGGQLNFPLDIVIDLGNDSVVVNRLEVHQRAFWYAPPEGFENEPYFYQNENFKAFNIYSSKDGVSWKLQGEYSIDDPRDEDGKVPSTYVTLAEAGHGYALEQATEPFRYLKLAITENFGSEIYVNISELTLYGSN
jgi:hypothetical protein